MAIQSAQDSLTTILCSRMTVLCRIQTCKQSVIEGFVVPAGMAFVCKVLRSIPSACDQRLLARLSCLRRGYYLTVETPVSFMQMGGLPTSAECSPSSQHTRSRGAGDVAMHSKSWPCTRVLKVNGRSTEVVEMKSPAGHSALQVLILPGNPGSAGYYDAYIASLHAALHGLADIYAAFSLQEQIDHKVAYIQQHLSGAGRGPVAIIGHSIGAYMALKVTKQLQALSAPPRSPEVAKVLAVFPFFQVDLSSRQQKMMRTLTQVPRLMGVIGAVLGILPLAIQKWLVNWWGGGLEDYAERATIGLLNYHSIKNGFYLGQTEFRDLAGPMDYKELEDLGDKVAVICNPRDTWFSQQSWEQMWLKIPSVKAYMEESQRHDFCVSRELSASLAQKSAELLRGSVLQSM